MTNNDMTLEIKKLQGTVQQLVELIGSMEQVSVAPVNNVYVAKKEYLTIDEVQENYGIKRSMQAKLRMDKENGIPYVRPAGSKVVLYKVQHLESWMEEWQAA